MEVNQQKTKELIDVLKFEKFNEAAKYVSAMQARITELETIKKSAREIMENRWGHENAPYDSDMLMVLAILAELPAARKSAQS